MKLSVLLKIKFNFSIFLLMYKVTDTHNNMVESLLFFRESYKTYQFLEINMNNLCFIKIFTRTLFTKVIILLLSSLTQ